MKTRRWWKVIGLIVMVALAPLWSAESRPAASFERTGVIDTVELHRQQLVIDDVTFNFPASAPVYRVRGLDQDGQPIAKRLVMQGALEAGMKVGFVVIYSPGAASKPRLQSVWILSPHSSTPHDGE